MMSRAITSDTPAFLRRLVAVWRRLWKLISLMVRRAARPFPPAFFLEVTEPPLVKTLVWHPTGPELGEVAWRAFLQVTEALNLPERHQRSAGGVRPEVCATKRKRRSGLVPTLNLSLEGGETDADLLDFFHERESGIVHVLGG